MANPTLAGLSAEPGPVPRLDKGLCTILAKLATEPHKFGNDNVVLDALFSRGGHSLAATIGKLF